MLAIYAFLSVVAISLLILRVGTIALMLTGLSEDLAAFQALSAFTGTGFTTSEAESMMSHPGRRRIVRDLMILGNMGVVSAVSTAILTVGSLASSQQGEQSLMVLLCGLGLISATSFHPKLRRAISIPIQKSLEALTDLELKDYADLLQVEGGYRVAELRIGADHWACGKTLLQLRLADEGVWILGIRRADGRYLGVPVPTTAVLAEDHLIVYGKAQELADLAHRKQGPEGDAEHRAAKIRADRIEAAEILEDRLALEAPEPADPEGPRGDPPGNPSQGS